MFMDNSTENAPEYFSSTAKLPGYKAGKPILTGLMTFLFLILLLIPVFLIYVIMKAVSGINIGDIFSSLNSSYDDLDAFTAPGAILSLGNLAVLTPAVFLAFKVTKERSFGSLITSRADGKWNKKLFRNALLLSLVVNALPQIIIAIAFGGFSHINIRFTVFGFIMFLLLLPLQCIGEEVLFRGFIGQTLGGWIKLPIVAILIQSVLFTLLHGYNSIGQISIFVTGLVFGLVTWKSKGIEIACAYHIINNWFSFVLSGTGLAVISTDQTVFDVVSTIMIDLVFLVCVFVIDKKNGSFTAD